MDRGSSIDYQKRALCPLARTLKIGFHEFSKEKKDAVLPKNSREVAKLFETDGCLFRNSL